MSRPTSLVEREIETKIQAALQAEIAKGKKPSDMGVRDFHAIAETLRGQVSRAAREELIRNGLEQKIKFVMGSMIAAVVWKDGTGWPKDDAAILHAARRVIVNGMPLKLSEEADALECFNVFREELPDMTRGGFHEYCIEAIVEVFRPLFIGQPEERTIGEIATIKAARGDKLAMSFLTWRLA